METYDNIGAIIDIFNDADIEYVFFNPGIDNVPLLETLAEYRASGKKSPRGILSLDEFVTMTAAHGNYMATGRPQAVSIHSELGTLQVGGSLHNAQWGKVPVIFFTEIQGPPERSNWKGEKFDQGIMVRNFVKWDHQMTVGEDIREVFQKAIGIATTEPYGPVYLAVPREMLWHRGEPIEKLPASTNYPSPVPKADESQLEKAVEILATAENPLIVTGNAGRNLETPPLLLELAETLGAQVQTSDIRVNFPTTHPLTAYASPTGGFGNPVIQNADVILAIDYDMHYAASPMGPRPDAKIIHIDIDTAKKGRPLWNRQPDIQIKADSSQAIPLLTALLKSRLTGQNEARVKKLEEEHNQRQKEWRDLALSHSQQKPITAHWLAYCINEVIAEDTVVVNQTISPSVIVQHLVNRTKPGSLLSCAGGCIGWAIGAALGVKLASPDKTVISLMGDGAFVYGCPEASLWSANFYKAPYLSIIFNNQGYGAIKGLFREKHDVDNMGADITSPPDYAKIAEACKAYGRTVENPDDVVPALKEGLERVKAGQPAVLDIRLKPV